MLIINGRAIGPDEPCYIIAEMSANHNGSFEKAMAIVRAARDAGADAIKVQTYTPDRMTLNCDNEYFRIHEGSLWEGKNLYQLYQEAMTPWEWHEPLQQEARRLGLAFFSSPFDAGAVDFLEKLNVPAYKIASFELVDDSLLKAIAKTGKPVILSTGLAKIEEIEHAVDILRKYGSGPMALLKCVSAYPADPADMNLRTIPEMSRRFGVVAGLSDHTKGSTVAVASVSLGARIIEKHLKLTVEDVTPDAAFSLTKDEFQSMVRDVRTVERALGRVMYGPSDNEKNNLRFRRSIFASRAIKKGEKFTSENIRVIRPGQGLAPSYFDRIVGTTACRDIAAGHPVSADAVSPECLNELLLREATEADGRALFDWRNDPVSRANSFDPAPLVWEKHLAWVKAKLAQRSSRIYILGQPGGEEIGMVRLDAKDGGVGEISIVINPRMRGRGFGAAALQMALGKARQDLPLRRFIAFIKPANDASRKVFERSGFAFAGQDTVKGQSAMRFEIEL